LIQETILVDRKYKIGLAVKKKGKKVRDGKFEFVVEHTLVVVKTILIFNLN